MKPLLERLLPWILGAVIAGTIATITILLVDPPDVGTVRKEASPQEPAPERPDVDVGTEGARDAVRERQQALEEIGDQAVAGVVRRPDGRPAAGARVSLFRERATWPWQDRGRALHTLRTTDGRFRFPVRRGPDLVVVAEHPDHVRAARPVHPDLESLTIRLEEGFEVSGLVFGARGEPMPQCRVVVEPDADTRRALAGETDDRGWFRFPDVRGGVVRVEARHRLFQPVSQTVTVGSSTDLRLVFDAGRPGVRLEGVVRTVDDRPVGGAAVHALPNTLYRALHEPFTATTGPDGRFLLEGLAPGNRWIEVRHPGYSQRARVIQIDERPDPLEFHLGPRSILRGRLVGDLGGVDGPVGLVVRTQAGERGRTRVGEDGAFAFPETFSAEDARLEIAGGVLAFARTASRNVAITIEERAETVLELEVVPPSVLTGRVVDSAGEPLAGTRVTALPPVYRKITVEQQVDVVTGADGRFELRGLLAGSTTLRVEGPDHARRLVAATVPELGGTGDHGDVVLEEGGSIRGRVTLGRRPVGGAFVFVTTGPTGRVSTVSRADGRFVLRRIAPGRYRVKARYGTLPIARSGRMVAVASGEATAGVDLTFRTGREIRGVVRGGDGEPVESAIVTVGGVVGTETRTDARGRFTINVPEQRDVQLWAYSPDLQVHTFQRLSPGQSEVGLELATAPSCRVTGTVLGLPGRRPVTDGILRVEPLEGDGQGGARSIPARGVRMPDGTLQVPGVPAGRSRLILQCQGYAPMVREIDVRPGELCRLGEVLLEPGSTVRGRVVDPDGRPVAGAMVYLGEFVDGPEFHHEPRVRTGTDGEFRLGGVTRHARRVVIVPQGLAVRVVDLELPRDVLRPEPLPVRLEEGTELHVRVVDEQERVWERGFVQLRLEGTPLAVVGIEDGGRARFRNLPAGRYEVSLFGRSGEAREVELGGGGGTREVELRVR